MTFIHDIDLNVQVTWSAVYTFFADLWALDSLSEFVLESTLFQVSFHLLLTALDRFFGGPYKESIFWSKSSRHDFFAIALELFDLRRTIGRGVSFGAVAWVTSHISGLNLKFASALPGFLQFLLYFIIFDFLLYVMHRIRHKHPFWIEHEFHHSAEELTCMTDMRMHALAVPLQFLMILLPLRLLFDLPMKYDLYFTILTTVISALGHSRWNTGYGPLGKYVFVSPRYHRMHHSACKINQTKNFGFHLVWWDRIFGTYLDPRDSFNLPVGLSDYNRFQNCKSVLSEYFKVFPRFAREVYRLIPHKKP